jgi:hypothetical protein
VRGEGRGGGWRGLWEAATSGNNGNGAASRAASSAQSWDGGFGCAENHTTWFRRLAGRCGREEGGREATHHHHTRTVPVGAGAVRVEGGREATRHHHRTCARCLPISCWKEGGGGLASHPPSSSPLLRPTMTDHDTRASAWGALTQQSPVAQSAKEATEETVSGATGRGFESAGRQKLCR